MFISALELFKIGIGPSSSHTMGPMAAAKEFIGLASKTLANQSDINEVFIRCTLKGSLAFTGKGHATDRAVALGLHGYSPEAVACENLDTVIARIWEAPPSERSYKQQDKRRGNP